MGGLDRVTEVQNHDLAQRMAELARASPLRRAASRTCWPTSPPRPKELIPGVDTAGVLLIGKAGTYESLAGTSNAAVHSSTTCR